MQRKRRFARLGRLATMASILGLLLVSGAVIAESNANSPVLMVYTLGDNDYSYSSAFCSILSCPPIHHSPPGHQPPTPPSCPTALVQPIFTATAYSHNQKNATWHDFYNFYAKYAWHSRVLPPNPDLSWLNLSTSLGVKYNHGWGHSYPLFDYLNSSSARSAGLVIGKNICVISDIDVDNGALFLPNGSRAFQTIIMGHAEYVTMNELNDAQRFVATGGKLIAMDSNCFYVLVNYNRATSRIYLVIGHGWIHNSSGAFAGPDSIFWTRTENFMSETYGWYPASPIYHFGALINITNPIGRILYAEFNSTAAFQAYSYHTEQAWVMNTSRTSMIAVFLDSRNRPVCMNRICTEMYIHQYRKGVVIGTCILSDLAIGKDWQFQVFLRAAVAYKIPVGK